MNTLQQIEEILTEASAYGLRNEVNNFAKKYLGLYLYYSNDFKIEIYQIAYRIIIQN